MYVNPVSRFSNQPTIPILTPFFFWKGWGDSGRAMLARPLRIMRSLLAPGPRTSSFTYYPPPPLTSLFDNPETPIGQMPDLS